MAISLCSVCAPKEYILDCFLCLSPYLLKSNIPPPKLLLYFICVNNLLNRGESSNWVFFNENDLCLKYYLLDLKTKPESDVENFPLQKEQIKNARSISLKVILALFRLYPAKSGFTVSLSMPFWRNISPAKIHTESGIKRAETYHQVLNALPQSLD